MVSGMRQIREVKGLTPHPLKKSTSRERSLRRCPRARPQKHQYLQSTTSYDEPSIGVITQVFISIIKAKPVTRPSRNPK